MKKSSGLYLFGAVALLTNLLLPSVMATPDFFGESIEDWVDETAIAPRPAPKTRSSAFRLPAARPLLSDYVGPESMREVIAGGLIRPTALATDDFDEDGVPDLVSGYVGASGLGLLTLHRGNVDAIYPHSPEAGLRKVANTFSDEPFLTPARIFEALAAPDFLGVGDFDNDGHRDIVAAARGSSSLYLYSGDGRGGLGAPRAVALEGAVTAMIAGEISRKDGLADVVVGIDSDHGPAVLVFEGPEGALDGAPRVVALPAAPKALALGRLDDDVFFDLAVAADRELMILHGWNSKPALRDLTHPDIGQGSLESVLALDSPIASIAVGRYVWDAHGRQQMAVLAEDGRIHLLMRNPSATHSSRQLWQVVHERAVLDESASGQPLVTARVSGLPLEELVILDRGASRLLVALGEEHAKPRDASDEGGLGRLLSGSLNGAPVAALPMRLNRDARSDLVLLQEGVTVPTVAASADSSVITVDEATDSGPAPGDGHCRLSEAIANANANSDTSGGDCTAGSGADTIEFAVTSVDVFSGLPAMTDPGDSIDGTTACSTPPCVELRGNNTPSSGLTINASGVTVRGLVVSGFDIGSGVEGGIFLTGGGSSIVEGNTIKNHSDGWGIYIIDSPSNTVGGTVGAARNTIIQNGAGMAIGADSPGLGTGNRVMGNYIGTDGTNPLGNAVYGINIGDAALQEIGGTAPGAGNVISSNGLPNPYNIKNGLLIHAYQPHLADGCVVQGNLIGLDASGTVAMSNEDGIRIWDASFTVVGGSAPAARNTISGNATVGIIVRPYNLAATYTTDNVVQGNYIGTDANGSQRRGNGVGIELRGHDHLIGGIAPGEGNVVSGNDQAGVYCSGGSGHRVEGNLIGTDVTGMIELGNIDAGVQIEASTNNTIGGATLEARNIVSGNGGDGVEIVGTGTSSNLIQGNCIGTDTSCRTPLGNAARGVRIHNGAFDNTVGGGADGEGNVIAHNTLQGVVIDSGAVGNSILHNSIVTNGNLGIDLLADGVTPNDPKDPDVGPNDLQNYPVLTLAAATPVPDISLEGSLNSTNNDTFRIEFFANNSCDESTHGEGERYLGFTNVTTPGPGTVSFALTLPSPVADGEMIVATATNPSNSTSEFSGCVTASCSGLVGFPEMIVASDEQTFSWPTAQDVRSAKGMLAEVSTYSTLDNQVLLGVNSLNIAADTPPVSGGLYYLIKPLGCGSWQTVVGAEPGRDSSLP